MMWIILLALAGCLFFGAKFSGFRQWHEDFLSLSSSKALLGISAVFIILHHTAQIMEADSGALTFFAYVGVWFVGLFFFFSGYGLYTSFKQKPDYLKSFFKRRYPAILIPFYCINWIFFFFTLLTKKSMKPLEIFFYLTGFILLNTQMWYIVEIAFLYLAFYLIFKYIKNQAVAILVMTLFVCCLMTGSLLLCHGDYWFQGEWWYNATLLFVIGILFSYLEKRIVPFFKKWYLPLLALFIFLNVQSIRNFFKVFMRYSYWSEGIHKNDILGCADKMHCLSAHIFMIVSFVFLVLLISMKLKCSNKLLTFLGKISLELYLIHNLFIGIFKEQFPLYPVIKGLPYKYAMILPPFLYTFAILSCSILTATILHYLTTGILSKVNRPHS